MPITACKSMFYSSPYCSPVYTYSLYTVLPVQIVHHVYTVYIKGRQLQTGGNFLHSSLAKCRHITFQTWHQGRQILVWVFDAYMNSESHASVELCEGLKILQDFTPI